MALEQAGLEFVAQGATQFLSTLQQAQQGTAGFGQAAQQASGKATGLGGVLSEVLTGALRRVGEMATNFAVEGLGQILNALPQSINAANEWAEKLDSVGDVLGTTSEESAALRVAVEGVGGDTDKFVSQLAFMQKGLETAKGKIGPVGLEIQKLGVDIYDANGQVLPATELAGKLADKFASMPDGLEKSEAMMRVFGKSGKDLSDVMGALAEGGLAEADARAKALGLSLSGDQVQASINYGRNMRELDQAFQGVSVSIGEKLLPIIQPLLVKFLGFVEANLPTVISAIGSAFDWVKQAVESARPTVDAIIAGLSQFGVTVGGIIATVQGFIANMQQGTEATNFFGQAWASLQASLAQIGAAIQSIVQTVFGNIQLFIETHGTEIKAFLDTTWASIQSVFNTAWEIIKTLVSAGVTFVQNTIVPAFQGIATFLSDHGAQIQAIINGAWEFIKSVISTAIGIVQGVLNTVLALIKGDWQGAWDSIKSTLQTIWDGIAGENGIVSKAINLVKSVINLGLAAIGTDWDTLWNGLKTTVEGIWNGIQRTIAGAVNGIIDIINGMIDAYNLVNVALGGSPVGHISHVNWGGATSAGASSYNYIYTYAPSYNMPVTTSASVGNIGYNFALMEAMAG